MLLHNVTLHNFGPYHAAQSLNLTTLPDRPVVLIGGLNGCGKTTLLDGIQLALYGVRARVSGRGRRSYDRYLRESVNRHATPPHAAVTVEFSTTVEGVERLYRIRRSWDASGKSVREALQVFIDGNLDPAATRNWADHIEAILPLEVASLFFFDGERIESLANPDQAASVIESAVHSLLGISIVEQLRTDLLAVQRRQKVSGEDAQMLEDIDQVEDELARVEAGCAEAAQQVAAVQQRLRQAEDHYNEAEEAFSRQGGDLYRRRGALEAEQQQLHSQLLDIRQTLAHTLATGALPLALLRPQLSALEDQTHAEGAAAQSAQVVELLTERDRRLLDTLTAWLPDQGLAAAAAYLAEDRKQHAAAAQLRQRLNVPRGALPQMAALDQVLAQQTVQAGDLIDQARQLRWRLEGVDRQVAGVPATGSIAAVMAARDAARDQVTQLRIEVAAAEDRLADGRRRRDQWLAQREQAYKHRAEHLAQAEHAARVVSYAARTRDTLARFRTALLGQHIGRLEAAVLDSFNRLLRKARLVGDLRIDTDTFTITLLGPDGDTLDPRRLSAGERQLLAVSLLWGLARVAGHRLPCVIDTPLGRLDSRHRQHLVDRYFPHASHQVLLLSTDEEIDKQLYARLQPSIARAYTLVHDDEAFTTTIHPSYRWAT
ncbi:DNA sulfur modification protein DndD [Actinomadura viridis]|uniref:DNA sulfur modification protein DndD n=1 Tax=Actinomadura viridis TaxID=58110 RepID=UPI0036C50464